MKRILLKTAVVTFVVVGPSLAQESDVTQITTKTTTLSSEADLLRDLWSIDDAKPLETGRLEFRTTFRWITSEAPANGGDSDDDSLIIPGLTWGAAENLELYSEVPVWVGDAGNRPDGLDGNADTTVGATWRFCDSLDIFPDVKSAAALRTSARLPTGDQSNGVDGELRLILTNDYESGLRSHLNAFGVTVNGDNDPDAREFQWGFLVGMDGPLCADGTVRWVADYFHRSSIHNGESNMNLLELGWEWDMAEAHKLGVAMQFGLDQTGDTPNFTVGLAYAYALLR